MHKSKLVTHRDNSVRYGQFSGATGGKAAVRFGSCTCPQWAVSAGQVHSPWHPARRRAAGLHRAQTYREHAGAPIRVHSSAPGPSTTFAQGPRALRCRCKFSEPRSQLRSFSAPLPTLTMLRRTSSLAKRRLRTWLDRARFSKAAVQAACSDLPLPLRAHSGCDGREHAVDLPSPDSPQHRAYPGPIGARAGSAAIMQLRALWLSTPANGLPADRASRADPRSNPNHPATH